MQYRFSEMSEHTNPATQHHTPEDMNHQQNCCGNLVSHKAQVPDQEVQSTETTCNFGFLYHILDSRYLIQLLAFTVEIYHVS